MVLNLTDTARRLVMRPDNAKAYLATYRVYPITIPGKRGIWFNVEDIDRVAEPYQNPDHLNRMTKHQPYLAIKEKDVRKAERLTLPINDLPDFEEENVLFFGMAMGRVVRVNVVTDIRDLYEQPIIMNEEGYRFLSFALLSVPKSVDMDVLITQFEEKFIK